MVKLSTSNAWYLYSRSVSCTQILTLNSKCTKFSSRIPNYGTVNIVTLSNLQDILYLLRTSLSLPNIFYQPTILGLHGNTDNAYVLGTRTMYQVHYYLYLKTNFRIILLHGNEEIIPKKFETWKHCILAIDVACQIQKKLHSYYG